MEKKKKIIALTVVLGIILTMVVVFIIKDRFDNKNENERLKENKLEKTIFITKECFDMQILGGDGAGWINVNLNKPKLEALFKDKINPKYEYGYDWLVTSKKICDETTIVVSKENNLYNGDEVTVTINVPKEILDKYDLIVEDNVFVYEISNLPEIYRFDPFDGVCFNVETDDNGNENVELYYYNDYLVGYDCETVFDFYTTDFKPISVDEFNINEEIIFVLNEEVIQEKYEIIGYLPETTSKTFVVKGDEKITKVKSVDNITEDFVRELKEDASTKILQTYKVYETISIENLKLVGAYFLDANRYMENELVMIFKVNVNYDNGNKTASTYLTTTTRMIFINENGENVVLGYRNELGNGSVLIDTNTLLQIRGEILENIMSSLDGYIQIKYQ